MFKCSYLAGRFGQVITHLGFEEGRRQEGFAFAQSNYYYKEPESAQPSQARGKSGIRCNAITLFRFVRSEEGTVRKQTDSSEGKGKVLRQQKIHRLVFFPSSQVMIWKKT